jgi:hypothetical protein
MSSSFNCRDGEAGGVSVGLKGGGTDPDVLPFTCNDLSPEVGADFWKWSFLPPCKYDVRPVNPQPILTSRKMEAH